MSILAVAAIAITIVVLIVQFSGWPQTLLVRRSPAINDPSIAYTSEVREIYRILDDAGSEGSSVAFLIANRVKRRARIRLEFYVGRGGTRFYWGHGNRTEVNDEETFCSFAENMGYMVHEEIYEDVWADNRCFHIGHGDLPGLCIAAMKELYDVADDEPMKLVSTDFRWQPERG